MSVRGSRLLEPHPVCPQARPVRKRRALVSRTPAMGQPPAMCCPRARPSASAPGAGAAASAKQVGTLALRVGGRWGEGLQKSGPSTPCDPFPDLTASERDDAMQPFLADFNSFSYLELKGLHTFERDLGLAGQRGG